MKIAIKLTLVFGLLVTFLWNSVPRLMSDIWHARDYVPAQSYAITDYKCTNWNFFMFNDCTVNFISLQSGESRQIMDFRFGRAPSDPVQLLQRRHDASSVTTDVSLRTVWNRVLVVFFLAGFGVVLAIGLIAHAFKGEDEPVGAPGALEGEDAPVGARSSEPALAPMGRATFGLEPTGRSTFGKRQA